MSTIESHAADDMSPDEARAALGLPAGAESLLLPLGTDTWAIIPDVLPRLFKASEARADLIELGAAMALQERAERQSVGGRIQVIPLAGVLTPRMSLMSLLFGGSGIQGFRAELAAAVQDDTVEHIVLDVDSPGGVISLIPETAAEVKAASEAKPVTAVANTLAGSAAYWIASQASEVVVSPSGDVGSIGVYMVHEDWSGANENAGVVPTYISAGKYKVEGNPDSPLSTSAREHFQGKVDGLYDEFVEAVAEGRGASEREVRSGYGEGRTVHGARAVAAGLADRVATLEGVLAELGAAPEAEAEVEAEPEPAEALEVSDEDRLEVAQLLALRP